MKSCIERMKIIDLKCANSGKFKAFNRTFYLKFSIHLFIEIVAIKVRYINIDSLLPLLIVSIIRTHYEQEILYSYERK